MPYYIFNFKKGDMSLEFESTDHRFVSYQLDKWIEEVAGITITEPSDSKQPAKTASQKSVKPTRKIIREEDIEVITEDSPVLTATESVEDLERQVESAIRATQNIIKDTKEIEQSVKEPDFDSFDQKVPEITGIVGELYNTVSNETTEELNERIDEITEEVQEIFIDEDEDEDEDDKDEKIDENEDEDEDDEDEDTDAAEDKNMAEASALDINEKAQNNKFYKILQEKFASLPEMVQNNLAKNASEQTVQNSFSETASIEELIDLKEPETLLDYLVVAAYYLKEIDLQDRYSLKQINSKVIKFIQKPINHAVIQEAVENNLLEVVPDYTGMADVTEYIITSEGINYLINDM